MGGWTQEGPEWFSALELRRRDGYQGTGSKNGVTEPGREAPLPAGMEVVLPDEREGGGPASPQDTNVKIATPSANHHTPKTMP